MKLRCFASILALFSVTGLVSAQTNPVESSRLTNAQAEKAALRYLKDRYPKVEITGWRHLDDKQPATSSDTPAGPRNEQIVLTCTDRDARRQFSYKEDNWRRVTIIVYPVHFIVRLRPGGELIDIQELRMSESEIRRTLIPPDHGTLTLPKTSVAGYWN